MVDALPLRIVFFGTPAFAVPTLDALLRIAAHRSSASSRSRIGRAAAARRPSDAPVKARALAAGLPVLQPERLKDPAFLRSARRAATPTSASSPPTARS